MALTRITQAGAGVARNNAFIQQSAANIAARISKAQQVKNAKADAIVKRGQAYTDDFYKLYGEQTRSGTEAWNAGAGELVGKLASEQEEMYAQAHGANGTPELRNAWRLRQIRDRGIVSNIGSWAALANDNATAMQENQSAHEQNTDLNRMTRGNDTDKYSFSQNMQNDQFSNYNFNIDDSGNVILDAQNVNKDGIVVNAQSRNLSADVVNNKSGNEWYSQIKEEDLLKNKLNKNWSDKNNGYNTLFKKQVNVDKVYKDGKWETITKEVYDPEEVKSSLLTNYKGRLDTEVLGPGFEKTWDQLWRNGYLKDDDGNELMGSEISWKDFRKIKSMSAQTFVDTYGDVDNDPSTDAEADKKYLQDQMMGTARTGLANYYSGNMVPAEDQITKITTEPGSKGSGGYSDKDKLKFKADQRYYNNFKKDSPTIIKTYAIDQNSDDTQKINRSKAVAKEMNRNLPTNKRKGEFFTGAQAKAILSKNQQDARAHAFKDNGIYFIVESKTANRKKDEPLFTYQVSGSPMRPEEVLTGNAEDLTFYMSSMVGIDDEAQNYLKTQKTATPPKK